MSARGAWLARKPQKSRLLVTCGLVLSLSGAARAEQAPSRKPPAERSVASAQDDAGLLRPPENLESLIFFSQRPAARENARKEETKRRLEAMLSEREKLVVVRREQAIKELEELVRTTPKAAPELPDALLRLSELRWEEARERYLREFGVWQKAPKNVRRAEPPKADLQRALALYERLLVEHPSFPRNDLVLYMKGYALLEAGRMSEALTAYKRIIEEHPESRFTPDAHMAFAEWHFSGQYDYQAALAEYDVVLRHPESELSDLALFKSAWCLWKLGRTGEAATRFREVLDLGGKLASVSGERKRRLLELQDEALEYLIQVFTEDERNSAADLHHFLSGIGGEKYAGKVLERLSRAFFDQARYARSIEAYQMLLASVPDAPRAPEHQRQIAAAHAALDDADATIEALRVLAATYAPGTPWAAKQADPEDVARARRLAERTVRTQGMRFHERAQKEKQTQAFSHAAKLYEIHVAHFEDTEHAYAIMFYLAEISFHRLGQPERAGELYVRAARKNPKGPFTKDALYNAILAFESVRGKELEACKPHGKSHAQPVASATPSSSPASRESSPQAEAKPLDPCSETPTDHKFSEATALYVELYPGDPEVPGILFRQGRLYFERGIYDPAIRVFGQLLDGYPQSPYAETAGELVLESFNRAKDYGNIELWARKLKSAPAFQNGESQRKLDALILQSVFKAGEQLSERGEHAKAAAAYLRAAEEFPRDERTPKAYYNAGQEWQRAGDLEAASEAYDVLIEAHAGSAEGALGARAGAQMFESIAQFGDAAEYYEAYARRFPKAEGRDDALYNAIVLRVTAGDYREAVEDGRELIKSFPTSSVLDEAYFLIGRAYEREEKWSDAADTYRRYQKSGKREERKIEAQTRLGQVLLAQGDRDGADKAWGAAAKAGKKTSSESGRYFAAQARFLQGDQVLAAFEKIQIAGDIKGLRKRLEQKSELLQKASSVYGDVVEYRVAEWLTAALYKIGRSYELFAESLREAPVPEGLSEVEEQTYRDELAKFIVPIEERALEAYEGGYRKALELRVFNAWTQKQREALTRLNDIEYPPLSEAGAELAQGKLLALPAPYDGLRRATVATADAGKAQANEGKNKSGARAPGSKAKRSAGKKAKR